MPGMLCVLYLAISIITFSTVEDKIKSLINTSLPRHDENDHIIHKSVGTMEISERSRNFCTLLVYTVQVRFEKGSFELNHITYVFIYSIATPYSKDDLK